MRVTVFALSMLVSVLVAPPAPALADEPPEPEPRGEREEKAEAEPKLEGAVDFVVGGTTVDVLGPGRPTRLEIPPRNVFDSTRVRSYVAILGLERAIDERLRVGARLPIVDGELESRTGLSDPRSQLLVGNLELEGAYVLAKGGTWKLDGALELGLPVGGGKEPPSRSEVAAEPDKSYAYAPIARFAAMRAASFSRGSYDTLLFESGRVGLAPKIGATFRFGDFTLRPSLKVENLLDVTGDATEAYIGELVTGVRASYRVAPFLEPGLHAWTNITYTEHEELNTNTLFVEPFVRLRIDNVLLTTSFMAPVVGSLVDEKTFGARVILGVEL